MIRSILTVIFECRIQFIGLACGMENSFFLILT